MSPPTRVDPEAVAFLAKAGCVYAEEEARILTEAADSAGGLTALLERRASGEPLEYIVGWAGFCGLRVRVRRGVFVPRRRSEFLAACAVEAVRAAADRTPGGASGVRLLDMCCGSGAIGLAVASQVPGARLSATDSSPVAVACARENLAPLGGRVYEGDLFEPLPRTDMGGFDVIVANAPYVPTGEIASLPTEARLHEPASALDGGPDGTDAQRAILDAAGPWLRPGGIVAIETGSSLAALTAGIAVYDGYDAKIVESSELDATVVVARLRD